MQTFIEFRRWPNAICLVAASMLVAGIALASDKSDKGGQLWTTQFSYTGYVKLDAMHSRYSAGDPGPTSIGRDFYIAATVPVGPKDGFAGTDFHIKQSRLRFSSSTSYFDDEPIRGHFELDFLLSPGGDERVSNSYNPRLRHGYFTFRNVLIGQTWTNLMDVAAFPDTLNFTASSESIIFVRQPQVRVSLGNLHLALENPETTVTPNGGGARIVAGDSRLPDFTGRYRIKVGRGHVALAAIARDLTLNDGDAIDDSKWGYGLSLTGKQMIGRHDLRFLLASGEGLGRYIGLNTVNGAMVTEAGRLDPLPVTGGYLAYRHLWNASWRSNLVLSALEADHKVDQTGEGVTRSVRSTIANLIYDWRPEVSFGVEYLHARRKVESGASGELDRLQFSAKYAF